MASAVHGNSLTPLQAVDRLEELHATAVRRLRSALNRFLEGGPPPDAAERCWFCYPELRLTYDPAGAEPPATRRAWAKFQCSGTYGVTVTQPAHFRAYLLEQLRHLEADFRPHIAAKPSTQEIPYPYVLEQRDAFDGETTSALALARHFPAPSLADVGDEVADSIWQHQPGQPRPLSLLDAVRVD